MNCCETTEEGKGEKKIEGREGGVTRGERERHDLSLIPLLKCKTFLLYFVSLHSSSRGLQCAWLLYLC